MSPEQTKYYFQLWKKACVGQGWIKQNGFSTAAVEEKRKEVHTEVFGSPISSKAINSQEDFGAIKAKFLLLAGDLNGAMEDGRPDLDQKRRLIWVIEHRLMPCMALYIDHVPKYVREVVRDKFKSGSDYRDLSVQTAHGRTSQLDQLLYTLNARVTAMRKEAGDSEHEMKIKAQVKCDCKECSSTRRRPTQAPSTTPETAEQIEQQQYATTRNTAADTDSQDETDEGPNPF